MLKALINLLAWIALISSGTAMAQVPAAVEFSAQTLQIVPKQQNRKGRIFVGQQRVRTELEMNGQVIVTIIDPVNQMSWVLYPEQQRYIEYDNRKENRPAEVFAKSGSPCDGVAGAVCKKLGEVDLQGRVAIKWDVVLQSDQGRFHSIQWVDRDRSILLRHESDHGLLMEQRLLGMDTLHNRVVEKWEQVLIREDALPQSSIRWFDPELNLAIKEEHPGGYIREMRDIQIAKQPESLFVVPESYIRVRPR